MEILVNLLVLVMLLVVITIVYILALLYIRYLASMYGAGPIYERSSFLVILANIANYSENVCNIICAFLFINHDGISHINLIPVYIASFCARIYAIFMIFRVIRVILLKNYRAANLTKDLFNKLSSFKPVILISFIYATLWTSVLMVIINYIGQNESTFLFYNMISYGFESLLLTISSFFVFRSYIHPSILVEYLFYSFFWVGGIFNYTDHYEDRWLYSVPIRNIILLLLSAISLHEHCESARPPLPLICDVTDIFQFKEWYEDYKKYLKINEEYKIIEACKLYKESMKAQHSGIFELLSEACRSTIIVDDKLKKSVERDDFPGIAEALEDILREVTERYIESSHLKEFRKWYFINFN